MKKKITLITILLNLVLLAVSIYFQNGKVLSRIDNFLYDYDMKSVANHMPQEDIMVVTIDDYSLEQLGAFPWDRAVYAQFLDVINQPGNEPKAIAFDILFNEESNPDSDLALEEAFQRHPNVILPTIHIIGNKTIGEEQFTGNSNEIIRSNSMDDPLPQFSQYTHVAHINRFADKDGVIRQNWLNILGPDDKVYNSLGYEAVKMYGTDLSKYENLIRPGLTKNTINIDYQIVNEDFTTMSFFDAMNGEWAASSPDVFKDKIVFVGFTASGLSTENSQDTGTTPLEKNVKLVYVHANIANQLLHGTLVKTSSNGIEISMLLVLFFLFIWVSWKLKNVYSIVIFLFAFILILYGQFELYKQTTTYVSVTCSLLAITLVYLSNISLRSYLENVQKSFVTRQFGRYISPDLVKQIVKNDIDIKLGGDLKLITILFLDIRGFTPLSEKLTPPELVDTLNTMFNMITETTLKNEGTIDKFIGDAAMILFNAPLNVAEHERMAVKTAYEIQQGMKKIRDEILEKYGCEVNVGIGIHTGNVVVGNIGSYLRVDYTAIGDNVNIAARIESQTKKGQVHVSEQVYEKTKAYFRFDEGEDRMFKGKSHPIKVYEVLGLIEE